MLFRSHHMNPAAILCVMGCYSQTNPEALQLEGVDILVGNGNKLEVINFLEDKFIDQAIEKKIKILDILQHHAYEKLEVTSYDHSRAFVKIEDGCENFCTYCIIPYARGPVRSKPVQAVIEEIRRIVTSGYQEVVLAGIHTGRYQDSKYSLSGLVQKIMGEVQGLKRLRLSSIEINEIDDQFLELMKSSKILADHLHLPLQSGSDVVLTKMERKYDTLFFKEKIEKIKKVRPDISITTDVIVGFPYETDEEFNRTVQFIEEIGFSKLHVFPYSVRRGTKAASMPQIEEKKKKERTVKLIELSRKLENTYASQFIGKTVEVLVEHALDQIKMIGHSSNYLQIVMPLETKYLGKNILVKIENIIEDNKVYALPIAEI